MMDFHRVDPRHELATLRDFLSAYDPNDYLLEDIAEWIHDGRLWAGSETGHWLAFGRLHDLGENEGWVSGFRVAARRRGQGLGGQLLGHIIADARSVGLTSLRASIEVENVASSRLFARSGFRPVLELTLRCGKARPGSGPVLPRWERGAVWPGPVGWLPQATGYVDVLPGEDGGRFGRWRRSLIERWTSEGKLYAAEGVAVAVQVDWWRSPRTLWVNPLQGDPGKLVDAVSALTASLGHEAWQAFLPSSEASRRDYQRLGLVPHPEWGDRVRIFERNDDRPARAGVSP